MYFIIDEDLPRSIAKLLQKYNHDAVDVRNIELRGVADQWKVFLKKMRL